MEQLGNFIMENSSNQKCNDIMGSYIGGSDCINWMEDYDSCLVFLVGVFHIISKFNYFSAYKVFIYSILIALLENLIPTLLRDPVVTILII